MKNFSALILTSAVVVVSVIVFIAKSDTKEELLSSAIGDMKSVLVLEQDYLKKNGEYFSLGSQKEVSDIGNKLGGLVCANPENEISVKTYTCDNTLFGYKAVVKNSEAEVVYDSCVHIEPQVFTR